MGELPYWTFSLGTGSPFLENYGFLYFYFTGFCSFLAQDLTTGIKFSHAIYHIGSGLAMFLFSTRLCRSRRAGTISGLGYVLCFWHLQQR